jgi:hypothetical protein
MHLKSLLKRSMSKSFSFHSGSIPKLIACSFSCANSTTGSAGPNGVSLTVPNGWPGAVVWRCRQPAKKCEPLMPYEDCRQIRNVRPESADIATRALERRSLTISRNLDAGTMLLMLEVTVEEGQLISQAIDKAVAAGDGDLGPEFNSNSWQFGRPLSSRCSRRRHGPPRRDFAPKRCISCGSANRNDQAPYL